MPSYRNLMLSLIVSFACTATIATAQSDHPGSKDHPKIPRVDGTTIIGYAYSDYDEGVFQTGMSGRKLLSESVEGKRTRIVYVGSPQLSPLQVLRNYQKAFEDIGSVEEVFSCRKNGCFNNLGGLFIWRKDNQIDLSVEQELLLYAIRSYYKDQIYWYGQVATSNVRYHVSVYSAIHTSNQRLFKRYHNRPLIHLEIVEVSDFQPTLQWVSAEEMSANIAAQGHVALYGIYFDFDSDTLKRESDSMLDEIAKTLNADPLLKLYVVGHTDNKGSVEYNEDLSKRRAQAVVEALIARYGIATERLVPIGVGLAAPVASNKTEQGCALNRRVELVER